MQLGYTSDITKAPTIGSDGVTLYGLPNSTTLPSTIKQVARHYYSSSDLAIAVLTNGDLYAWCPSGVKTDDSTIATYLGLTTTPKRIRQNVLMAAVTANTIHYIKADDKTGVVITGGTETAKPGGGQFLFVSLGIRTSYARWIRLDGTLEVAAGAVPPNGVKCMEAYGFSSNVALTYDGSIYRDNTLVYNGPASGNPAKRISASGGATDRISFIGTDNKAYFIPAKQTKPIRVKNVTAKEVMDVIDGPSYMLGTDGLLYTYADETPADGATGQSVLGNTYGTVPPLTNAAPNAPSNLNPAGTAGSPAAVSSIYPIISWSYTNPDGIPQAAYMIKVYKADGTLVHNPGYITGRGTAQQITTALLPDTLYYYTVSVKDDWNNVSPTTAAQYFKTGSLPVATPTGPLGTSGAPGGASVTPRITWGYSDVDGHAQSKFSVTIRDQGNTVVHTSGTVTSANKYYDVPANANLASGTIYSYTVQVTDSSDMTSAATAAQYFLTNTLPGLPNIIGPVDTKRVPVRPSFTFIAGDDVDNDAQGFRLQLAVDSGFTTGLTTYDSTVNPLGWWYLKAGEWVSFPAEGKVPAADVEGAAIKYLAQSDLTAGSAYYWRVASVDGTTGSVTAYTTPRTVRCGDVLRFSGSVPVTTTAAAERAVLTLLSTIAADGIAPATLTVEVTNNAFDDIPTWEDCTAAYKAGTCHLFGNKVKTAEHWGVNYRVTVNANDSLGAIVIDAIGLSFD